MPSDHTFEYVRMRAYIGNALRRNGYTNDEQASLTERILETLKTVEVQQCNDHLLQRIEDRLATPALFKNTGEHVLLRNAIDSMMEPRTRWERKREVPLGNECQLLTSREVDPFEHVATEELRRQVRQRIDGLSEDQRRLITSRFWEGMTEAQFGRQIGIARQRVNEMGQNAAKILEEQLKPVWDLYVK